MKGKNKKKDRKDVIVEAPSVKIEVSMPKGEKGEKIITEEDGDGRQKAQ